MKSLKTMTFALLITGPSIHPLVVRAGRHKKRPTSSHPIPENLRRVGREVGWGHGKPVTYLTRTAR